ncbi:sigma-54 dependent transcriptional regulator [Burkholderia sp. Ac-20365]|uniref:sigma-54 interaction domain-containing protein n=1 Tax=Burkholderia sp. Ac-20365 TaxID=2703897 RepID=UPI0032179DDF
MATDAASLAIVGTSPPINALKAYLPKVARSHATALVTGETGTGKELVARAIHELGPRAQRPFVVVNCGALPDTLVESELFGHARGAFTGAHTTTQGRFAAADGGTLFLDEVGELSLPAQAKLLRVLESKEIEPLGGGPLRRIDVRVVAATNRELQTEVLEKRFRADLFYRLNVARLDIPPLRERRPDIPLLAHHAVAEFNRRDHCRVGDIGEPLMECLMAHDWPGNVRELRNLIEAVFIDPPQGTIRFEDLPPVFQRLFGKYRTTSPSERARMIDALEQSRGNKAEAAKSLKCSRMTLYRKLARYNITSTLPERED